MDKSACRMTMFHKTVIRSVIVGVGFLAFCAQLGWSQGKLSVHWEELTAADFRSAIQQSQGTCLLPFGILEKHGPHLPLGTDLLDVRYAALHAAEQEYAVVFPNITLARSLKPGTNPARSPTAGDSSYNYCRKPPTRWRATVVKRSSS
jgi:hypothetical protein